MYVNRYWHPAALPEVRGPKTGQHARLIHALSDALRRYCESLWYSGLEYKRPTHEEILAKSGILFYERPVPAHILYSFYYQLENLFAMSKVVHVIRTITDWLNAAESRASRVISIYEMNAQLDYFEETLSDYLKSLKLCDRLLDNLGSIYHRVRPLDTGEQVVARAVIDYHSSKMKCTLHSNNFYHVTNNQDPHTWQVAEPKQMVPSMFLEVSPEGGERTMLKNLQKRFEEFLILCHGRTRRQLFSHITKILHSSKRYSTLPSMRGSGLTLSRSDVHDGLYFPKYPNSSKRWRSSSNGKVFCRQPTFPDYESPEEALLPNTIRILMTRLRCWLLQLPSPAMIMQGELKEEKKLKNSNLFIPDETAHGSRVVDELRKWWRFTQNQVPNREQVERIVSEAIFMKNLNEILQTKVNLDMEKNNLKRLTPRRPATPGSFDSHCQLTQVLVEELLLRLGAEFYHPRSGQFSYRTLHRSIDSPDSPLPPSIPGINILDRITTNDDIFE